MDEPADKNASAWQRAVDEIRAERPDLAGSASDDDLGGDDVPYWDAVERRAVELGGRRAGPARDLKVVREHLRQLVGLDRQRLHLINDLRAAGLLRSRGLVGEWGELIACALLGGELAAPSQAGFDLVDARQRQVQVKTLRSTATNHRTSLGIFREPFDVALCVRLDLDYQPVEAFEIPAEVIREIYGPKRASLTKRLETHPATLRYAASELLDALER